MALLSFVWLVGAQIKEGLHQAHGVPCQSLASAAAAVRLEGKFFCLPSRWLRGTLLPNLMS